MSNCSNQFPHTDTLYKELRDTNNVAVPVLIGIGCLLAVILFGIFAEEIWFIIRHYPHKTQRTKLIYLLGLYPVVCLTSLLSIIVPTATLICELIASAYLSICIVLFINMVMGYFGGRNSLLQMMSKETMTFATPPFCCCCLCLNNKPFNARNLKIATMFAFQIAIVKPIALFIVVMLWTNGSYMPGDETNAKYGAFYTNWFSVLSTIFGIYGMAIIYRSTRDKLQHFNIRAKFASVQLILIFMNFQFAIIGILARYDIPACEGTRGSRVRGYRIQHSMLVIESFLVAILARYGYRHLDPELLHNQEITISSVMNNGNAHSQSVDVQDENTN